MARKCPSDLRHREDYQHRRKERLRAARREAGRLRRNDWCAIKDYYGHRCAYCGARGATHGNGRDIVKMTKDHVVPIMRGGTDSPDNVVPACPACNQSKGGDSLLIWLARVGRA